MMASRPQAQRSVRLLLMHAHGVPDVPTAPYAGGWSGIQRDVIGVIPFRRRTSRIRRRERRLWHGRH